MCHHALRFQVYLLSELTHADPLFTVYIPWEVVSEVRCHLHYTGVIVASHCLGCYAVGHFWHLCQKVLHSVHL